MQSLTCPASIHTADSEQPRNHSVAIRLVFMCERAQDWIKENQKGEVLRVNKEIVHLQRLSYLLTSVDQCSTKIMKDLYNKNIN